MRLALENDNVQALMTQRIMMHSTQSSSSAPATGETGAMRRGAAGACRWSCWKCMRAEWLFPPAVLLQGS